MITLTEQIISFIFSFIYGIVIGLIFYKTYKLIYTKKAIYKILNSFLFSINTTLVYFYVFRIINNGYINIYFVIITLIMSFLSYNYLFTKNMSK